MASELEVGKLGAGVAPAAPLHAKVAATNASSPLEVARLEVEDNLSGVNMNAGMGPKLSFYAPRNTTSIEGASIAAKKESDTDDNEATTLAFSTCPVGGTNTERLTIDSTGHIILPTAGKTIKTDLSSGGTTRTSVIELYNPSTAALSLKTDNGSTGGIEFWTEGAKRLDVQRDGVCTFSNGITVNDAGSGIAQVQTGGSVTIADDSSITISTSSNYSALISVYDGNSGKGVLFFVSAATVAQIISDPSSIASASDTDGKICLIKTTGSHACTLKNRLGSQSTFLIAQLGGTLV